MEEHDLLEQEAKVLLETLELMLIGMGLVVLGYLGSPVLMPMIIGLALFFPCACAIRVVEQLRK